MAQDEVDVGEGGYFRANAQGIDFHSPIHGSLLIENDFQDSGIQSGIGGWIQWNWDRDTERGDAQVLDGRGPGRLDGAIDAGCMHLGLQHISLDGHDASDGQVDVTDACGCFDAVLRQRAPGACREHTRLQ
ncbi:hypothetical protein [Delftia acidovorans]|uniref:hypothetical protein n=1 Tax=Delftia acidovorans TaxID=80866 RepID=UPI003D0A0961